MNIQGPDYRYHTLVVTVENKSGVLARVASLFARRAFNIESLAVAPTDDEMFSRITVVVDLESAPLDQIVKQLDKLVNVVEIRELHPGHAVERELMLVTVSAEPDRRDEIVEHLDRAGGKVLSVGTDRMMLSLVGLPARVDEFEDLLRPYGIVELQRTGRVALATLDDGDGRAGNRSSTPEPDQQANQDQQAHIQTSQDQQARRIQWPTSTTSPTSTVRRLPTGRLRSWGTAPRGTPTP